MALPSYKPSGGGQRGQWDLTADDGTTIKFTSFIELEFRGASKVAEEALEQGTFSSYNKTDNSDEATVTLGMSDAYGQGGDNLENAITNLKKLLAQPIKCTIVTPDHVLSSMTIEGLNYTRSADDGVAVLIVEIKLREVREIGDVSKAGGGLSTSAVKNPATASTAKKGNSAASKASTQQAKVYESRLHKTTGKLIPGGGIAT